MLKLRQAFLIFASFALLGALLVLSQTEASASLPFGITLTPTEEITDTPEAPTATPEQPTATPTNPVQPPESSPTPTSDLATPTTGPTDTPEPRTPRSPRNPTPTRPPVLPETGESAPGPDGLNGAGLLAALLFALTGTLIFRALSRSRASR
jgi:hypothetical protein